MVVSILGCGWFGVPLAKDLISKGYAVKGSTTTADKISILSDVGIKPFKIEIAADGIIGDSAFFACDVLVISITPRMRDGISYPSKIDVIVTAAISHNVKKILLISSTGVYGEYNASVNEDTLPKPDTDSGRTIREAEQIVTSAKDIKGMVLRFGGLIGPGRHPGRFLAGKTDVANGRAPVNLIHLTDCVNISSMLVASDYDFDTINAVCPDHPLREDFYTLATKQNGLVPPVFARQEAKWKIVESKYLTEVMHYNFVVADLLKWIMDNNLS